MSALQRTAEAVAFSRRYGVAKRRQRIPKQIYPKLIELEYAKAMVSLVRTEIRPAFAPLLSELPALLTASNNDRARQDVGGSRRARELVDAAQHHMAIRLDTSRIEALAQVFADRTQRHNAEQLGRQVRAALGVDVFGSGQHVNGVKITAVVDHFVQQNVALIKSIPSVITTDVDKLVTHAFASGMPHPELAEHIEQKFSVGESRARLIARDQIGKISGQLNASRQQAIGITRFTWQAVMDERTRPEHEDLNGQEFDYDDPPDEGLPGEAVCCRCSAEPIFDGILDDVDATEAAADDGNTSTGSSADASGASAAEGVVFDVPKKNPKRVEAAKKAGEASAERTREIHSAVKGNLAPDLHVAWDKEGHKFLRQEAGRIKGMKDRINAASKISEAFAETYGSGESTAFGNEGDRYFKRAELEAKHAETWADEQERKYYEEMQRDGERSGDIDENGELTKQGQDRAEHDAEALHHGMSNATNDDPPF